MRPLIGILFCCLSTLPLLHAGRGYDAASWDTVPADFSWNQRRIGTTQYWNPLFGIWKHYNITSLLQQPLDPIPWTEGRMVRNSILLNASAYQLWSMYERSAVGRWPVSPEPRIDGLLEAHHIYTKTPYRLTELPGVALPASVNFPDGHDSSRMTVVQPDAASFSGPRWLPSENEAAILEYMQQQGKDPTFYRRWSFCELWLYDSVDKLQQACNKGLFCQYHGLTGELLQVFCMRERALLPTTSPEALVYYNPDVDCDLNRMEKELSRISDKIERAVLRTTAARALAAGEPIERVLELGAWSTFSARLVTCQGLLDPEVACSLENQPAEDFHYASPFQHNPDAFLDIRWSDGTYARIPKKLTPDMDDISFELGGLTTRGDFHRVMAVGSRSSGMLHTTLYERWSKGASLLGMERQDPASFLDMLGER